MNTSANKVVNKRASDSLDRMIFEEGLQIKNVFINKESDVIIVLLNNRKIIQRNLSDFKRLKNATLKQLLHFHNDGRGIHWPEIDEDLSLRGFLKHELMQIVKPANA